MGAADFNTGATIQGTKDEVFAILKVMYSYVTTKREQYREKRNCPYLMSMCINGDNEFGMRRPISDFADDELMAYIEEKKCAICVDASGPYGVFGLLEEIDLFHEMAEAAPNAKFEGGMGGFGTGGDQCANFELKNGLLHCKYSLPSDDWDEDGYDDEYEDDWDEDDEWADEEPDWDKEVIYDPVKKKYVEQKNT